MPRRTSADDQIGIPFDAEGRPSQSVAVDLLRIPKRIELVGKHICYAYQAEEHPPRGGYRLHGLNRQARGTRKVVLEPPIFKIASPRTLDGFIKLADGSDDDILSFARRRGVLDLCQHGLAVGQPDIRYWMFDHRGIEQCSPHPWPEGAPVGVPETGKEHVDFWRAWSRRARALLHIAGALHCRRAGENVDWQALAEPLPGEGDWGYSPWFLPSAGKSADRDAPLLQELIYQWVATGQVAPRLTSNSDGDFVVRFACGRYGRLFGVIGFQLMLRAAKTGSLAVCCACGVLYKPTRLIDPRRRNFCADCGRPAAVRMAKRAHAKRKDSALRKP